jgi:hypothetical protein
MNLGQMTLVMLGLILFSTVILMMNNNQSLQSDSLIKTLDLTQADYYVDWIFQQYETDVIRKRKTTTEIFNDHATPDADTYLFETDINGTLYSVKLRAWPFNPETYLTIPSPAGTNSVLIAAEVKVVNGNKQWLLGTIGASTSRIRLFETGSSPRLIDSPYNRVITFMDI